MDGYLAHAEKSKADARALWGYRAMQAWARHTKSSHVPTYDFEEEMVVEARAALREAKKDYGDISPTEYDTLATQFGGVAHAVTVRVIEGFTSEKLYNKALEKGVEKADLPAPPQQHELT